MAAVKFFASPGPHHLIFSELSDIDLFSLAQTCWTIYDKVYDTCHDIYALLRPFFDSDDLVDEFRSMQAKTGTLISGSTALLFFLRPYSNAFVSEVFLEKGYDITAWNQRYLLRRRFLRSLATDTSSGDLDLYVEHRYAYDTCMFLQSVAGYVYEPRGNQNSSWEVQLDSEDEMGAGKGHGYKSSSYGTEARTNGKQHPSYYRTPNQGISHVLNFFKTSLEDALDGLSLDEREVKPPLKMIQVIASKQGPVDVILKFHSTCVMNIISHKTAYSLFPRATFMAAKSFMMKQFVHEDEATSIRAKYRKRGWEFPETFIGAHHLVDPFSAFRIGFRWIGDPHTWTIPLASKNDDIPDTLPIHSFEISYKLDEYDSRGYGQATYKFAQTQDPVFLKYTYLTADPIRLALAWKDVQSRSMREGFALDSSKASVLLRDSLVERRRIEIYTNRSILRGRSKSI